MNDKKQAAADLKWFARRLRGVLALTEDLDVLSSLDQAEANAKARIEAADKAAVAQRAQLDAEADARRKEKDREFDAHIADAHREVGEILKKARADADEITAKATADATVTWRQTQQLRDQIKDMDAELKAKQLELGHLTTEAMQQVAILSSAREDLAHAQAEHARLKALIESIKL